MRQESKTFCGTQAVPRRLAIIRSVTPSGAIGIDPSGKREWHASMPDRSGPGIAGGPEAVADRVNWHEVAKLVHHGCPPSLALKILE